MSVVKKIISGVGFRRKKRRDFKVIAQEMFHTEVVVKLVFGGLAIVRFLEIKTPHWQKKLFSKYTLFISIPIFVLISANFCKKFLLSRIQMQDQAIELFLIFWKIFDECIRFSVF